MAGGLAIVALATDQKRVYGLLARAVFGDRLRHETTSSLEPRTAWNPLFPINHTEAMMRDLNGRLRRRSWLVSKKGQFLGLQLLLHMTWRNYVREHTCRDVKRSAAQILGFTERRLTSSEVLGWRQDWRERSPSLVA